MSDPTPHQLLTELFEAVEGESWARPDPPSVVWAGLIADVKQMRAERDRYRDRADNLEETLRLAATAVERSSPHHSDDVRWARDVVQPAIRAALADGSGS